MLKILYGDADAGLAQRLMADLAPVDDLRAPGTTQTREDMVIFILSRDTMKDSRVTDRLYEALDQYQHVIPALTATVRLPNVIDNLVPVDFTISYAIDALRQRIAFLSSPEAPRPLRVLTPRTRRSNWRFGAIFIALAVSMFCIGLLAIGGGVSRPPEEEYNAVATAIQGTVDIEIQEALAQYMLFLPRGTEQAANYAATLQIVPTRYRPFMARTATRVVIETQRAAETGQPIGTPTPTPES